MTPGLRQLDSRRRTNQQREAHCRLEIRDTPAQCGSGNVIAAGGASNRAFLHDGDEQLEAVRIDSHTAGVAPAKFEQPILAAAVLSPGTTAFNNRHSRPNSTNRSK